MDPNSYSFIRFQCILHDSELKKSDLLGSPFCISILKVSAWFRSTFLCVLKFLQIKEGGPTFWGEPIFQNVRIISSPLLDINFKSFTDTISSSLTKFQWILHDSLVLFSECWNFYKLKRGGLISGGNLFCRKPELFYPPFWISILKVLWTQFLRRSLYFSAFFMIQE